ncbi:MAG: PAS domain-containing sensor histidine kinase [Desulfuromonadales bacterium]|nr:PAS domain-containing sensor histidine kinase [Desulfuromonadales bacterium]
MPEKIPTRFAPAERADAAQLRRQVDYFSRKNLTSHLLDAIPSILIILNQYRQIVYVNRSLLDLLGAPEEDFVLGLRPGEVLRCVHAGREPGGCGTAEPCTACGMVAAILASLAGRKEVRECRLLRQHEGHSEAIDLLVWATPLEFNGENFSVFALSDISHQKRRQALERIFFHDVLNVIGSIKGFSELLKQYDPPDRQTIYTMIQAAADQAIDEIEAQRILAAAESRELKVRSEPLSLSMFITSLLDLYRYHPAGQERHLVLAGAVPELVVLTDRTLLARILGNMLKNALEAAAVGETVTLACARCGGQIEFAIHNRGPIEASTQLEIFQRSFSTKGEGRGLGTYSMKILGEFLGAEVSFASDETAGTTFRLLLPLVPA